MDQPTGPVCVKIDPLQPPTGIDCNSPPIAPNPDSVLAALAVLAGVPGPRWAVLGDMAEAGTQGAAFHAEVGERARALGIDHLWAVGGLGRHTVDAAAASGTAARHFDSMEALLQALRAAPPAAGASLVKRSRAARNRRLWCATPIHRACGAVCARRSQLARPFERCGAGRLRVQIHGRWRLLGCRGLVGPAA